MGKGFLAAGGIAAGVAGAAIRSKVTQTKGSKSHSLMPIGKIPEGEAALRTRLGRARRVRNAWFSDAKKGDLYGYEEMGWHRCLSTSLRKTTIQQHDYTFEHTVQHKDGDKLAITSTLWFSIDMGEGAFLNKEGELEENNPGENLYRFIYKPTGEQNNLGAVTIGVAGLCMGGLYQAVRKLDEPFVWNNESIYREVKADAEPVMRERYGVRLDDFVVGSIALADAEVNGKQGLTNIAHALGLPQGSKLPNYLRSVEGGAS